jgi:6-phosphogluconolactonase
VTTHPGAGPRHLAFDPSGRFAFVIDELDSTLISFAYDAAKGTLREVQRVSTLPAGYSGRSHTADVHVSVSGRFVYGSNRGHDSLATFGLDGATGRLDLVGIESTRGMIPRNFALDPTGAYLYAANERTDNIIPFRIDQEKGTLTPTGEVIAVPEPVCIQFAIQPA